MPFSFDDTEKIARKITLFSLVFIIIIGAALVVFQVKPFWVDEWFIILNLKTKTTPELFGQLYFLQQFPRVYLVCFKLFTAAFNYSYQALRLPSFLVSVSSVFLLVSLMKTIYRDSSSFTKYLFVILPVSTATYLGYFAEVKQYPMDIFLSILAVWQLVQVLQLASGNKVGASRYVLLCATFFIVPFFSYTYPIVIAPVYFVVFLQTILRHSANNRKLILSQWLPLILGTVSIVLFYRLDVHRLVTDKIMYDRWDFGMVGHQNRLLSSLSVGYRMFAQVGSGLLFETLLGILGVVALFYGAVSAIRRFARKEYTLDVWLAVYATSVLVIALALLFTRKLPCNPRLNAFATLSITILIIYFFNNAMAGFNQAWQRSLLPTILFLGVTGNIYSTYINYFTSPIYKKQLAIYNATTAAILRAQDANIPVFIAPGIAYPYEQATIDAGMPDHTVWVLKTFPAYNVSKGLPVYAMKDTASFQEYLDNAPIHRTAVMVGDGINYRVMSSHP